MKIVRIIGGLGNQMFEYAFLLALKSKFQNECFRIDLMHLKDSGLHNGFELQRVFGIQDKIASYEELQTVSMAIKNYRLSAWARRLLSDRKYELVERVQFKYNSDVFLLNKSYYEGYWQNEAYFSDIKEQIRSVFRFRSPVNERNSKMIQEIQSSNSVSIHVRRGDYLKHAYYKNICELDYYKKTIDYVINRVDHPIFYIFSNDTEWCRTYIFPLLKDYPGVIVDWNNGNESYVDMQLMSLCKHNIVANSSFSWWGAWLNENADKMVLSPSKWANCQYSESIIPESWITF